MSIELKWLTGQYGRTKISSTGTTTVTGNFIGVKAIGTTFTYGAGCTALHGDPPAEDDTVIDGNMDWWPATKVVAKTGAAYVYYDREQ